MLNAKCEMRNSSAFREEVPYTVFFAYNLKPNSKGIVTANNQRPIYCNT